MFFKCLIAGFAFVFVVYVLKAIARLRFFIAGTMGDVRRLRDQVADHRGSASSASALGADMVRCQACGAFVAVREAVTIRSRNARQSFCSDECLRRHVK
ncbi:MAG: hypothetical protein EBZ36_05480 [Acidobacteria bacterium]|nr:hypothetical protein [Acidobacteriota bacterium]